MEWFVSIIDHLTLGNTPLNQTKSIEKLIGPIEKNMWEESELKESLKKLITTELVKFLFRISKLNQYSLKFFFRLD